MNSSGTLLITPLSRIPEAARPGILSQSRDIFWETAGNPHFKSPDERLRFAFRYFESYLHQPELFFIAMRDNTALGYLAGAEQTTPEHFESNPYLEHFKDLIQGMFPAHLHINLSSASRGTGTGSRMIEEFEKKLKKSKVKGMHIVTLAAARNVAFYEKNGFGTAAETDWNGNRLVMLGKSLPR